LSLEAAQFSPPANAPTVNAATVSVRINFFIGCLCL
jgi:hypothetical protein